MHHEYVYKALLTLYKVYRFNAAVINLLKISSFSSSSPSVVFVDRQPSVVRNDYLLCPAPKLHEVGQ